MTGPDYPACTRQLFPGALISACLLLLGCFPPPTPHAVEQAENTNKSQTIFAHTQGLLCPQLKGDLNSRLRPDALAPSGLRRATGRSLRTRRRKPLSLRPSCLTVAWRRRARPSCSNFHQSLPRPAILGRSGNIPLRNTGQFVKVHIVFQVRQFHGASQWIRRNGTDVVPI